MTRAIPSHPGQRIGPDDLAQLRRDGPAALTWMHGSGRALLRSQCIGLVMGGVVPMLGVVVLGWPLASLLAFLIVDAAALLVGDALKLRLAPAALHRTREAERRAWDVLAIVAGLEDGSCNKVQRDPPAAFSRILCIALISAALAAALLCAGIHALEPGTVARLLAARGWMVGAALAFAVTVGGALWASLHGRRADAGDAPLVLESGGIAGLLLGLVMLAWMPVVFGQAGVMAAFMTVCLFRIVFGAGLFGWSARLTRALQRRLREPQPG